MKKMTTVFVLALVAAAAFAQAKPRLAILPFTGGSPDDAETIAEFFSFEVEINRVFVPVPRTRAIEALMKEQEFQRSGLTDSDTIAALGRQLNADYVLAGHIAALGDRKLLLITIIDVEELQQIAGDYEPYQRIESVIDMMPRMARRIAEAATRRPVGLPRLAVLPFNALSGGVDQQEAELLAQLLATEIANSGYYAVFPRTKAVEKVMEEHRIERSGMTDAESVRTIGEAVNARYVLSASVRKLGNDNYFSASILHIEEASQGQGTREKYGTISDGLALMPKIAQVLTGIEDFKYYAASGKTITITGYTGDSKQITMPARINNLPVTAIGAGAFREKGLTSVTIPDSVTSIGSWAFRGNQLSIVTIPNSVTSIGAEAFRGNSLYSVTIPNSVTSIGTGAFRENRLTSVTIGNSVKTIGGAAFFNNQLTSVTIPNSVTTIEDAIREENTWYGAFGSNQLISVTIGNSVKTIGWFAFENNQLTSVIIPNSVTTIGDDAFEHNRLTSVTIGNSVTFIGNFAFSDNRLTSVTIPNSVTAIGLGAFFCISLTSVTIGANINVSRMPFYGNLEDVYTNNGKRAGTYTSRNEGETWRKQ